MYVLLVWKLVTKCHAAERARRYSGRPLNWPIVTTVGSNRFDHSDDERKEMQENVNTSYDSEHRVPIANRYSHVAGMVDEPTNHTRAADTIYAAIAFHTEQETQTAKSTRGRHVRCVERMGRGRRRVLVVPIARLAWVGS
jgi:hypothetical protein